MATILILVKQVIIMFILAFIGYLMLRTKRITMEGSKSIGNILIYLSLPSVIINGFLVERTPDRMMGLLISAGLALVVLVGGGIISKLLLGRNTIEVFASTFSNPGFFGIPLIVASMADGAVFYIAAFIAFVNLGQWTYGVWLLENTNKEGLLYTKEERAARAGASGKSGNGVKALLIRLIKAPFMVGTLIGLFFFLTAIPMPEMVGKILNFLAGINTPLAMFTVGIYLAQTDLAKMFAKKRLYWVTAVRMIIVPIVCIFLLYLVPNSMMEMKMAMLIVAACPVGSNVAVYAQLHDADYAYAVETVIISTLFSIILIPAMVALAGLIW